jgi:hypothetical protein
MGTPANLGHAKLANLAVANDQTLVLGGQSHSEHLAAVINDGNLIFNNSRGNTTTTIESLVSTGKVTFGRKLAGAKASNMGIHNHVNVGRTASTTKGHNSKTHRHSSSTTTTVHMKQGQAITIADVPEGHTLNINSHGRALRGSA